jgi:uncharacterized protein YndB with AHSA1/START domain
MNTKTIFQTVTLPAKPAAVFAALMDGTRHAAFTGAPAVIDARVGGTISCYGGYISGITVELVPNRRIVQAWRGRTWPKGFYSLVTFALAPSAGGKTRLTFTQVGVPVRDFKAKSDGWRSHYWEPLKRYLANSR